MRVVLHIGMSKTGTSSLQRSLRLASAEPETWPMAYPTWPAGTSSHHEVAALYASDRYLPRALSDGGRRTAAEARAAGQRAWEGVVAAGRGADVLVLSSEMLFAIDDASAHDLARRIGEVASSVEVACYVRPPAAHYVAALSQRLRFSHRTLPPSEHRMQLAARIGRFADAFDGNVVVRPYDRSRLVGGDIIEDFRARFLPDLPPLPRPPARGENTSLSPEGICLARELRLHAWLDDDDDATEASQLALERLGAIDEGPSASASALVDGLADAITWAHDVDLQSIEERWGVALTDRVPPPQDACPAWTSEDPAEILRIDPERLERLRWRLVRGTAEQLVTARRRIGRLEARLAEANERRREAEARTVER